MLYFVDEVKKTHLRAFVSCRRGQISSESFLKPTADHFSLYMKRFCSLSPEYHKVKLSGKWMTSSLFHRDVTKFSDIAIRKCCNPVVGLWWHGSTYHVVILRVSGWCVDFVACVLDASFRLLTLISSGYVCWSLRPLSRSSGAPVGVTHSLEPLFGLLGGANEQAALLLLTTRPVCFT